MTRVRSLPRLHRHQRRLYDLNRDRALPGWPGLATSRPGHCRLATAPCARALASQRAATAPCNPGSGFGLEPPRTREAALRTRQVRPSDSPLPRLCDALAQGYECGGKPRSHHPWSPPTFHGRQRSRSRCLGARFPKLFVYEHLVCEPVVHRLRPSSQWIGIWRGCWTNRRRWPSKSSAAPPGRTRPRAAAFSPVHQLHHDSPCLSRSC
jgi:hypothetical protein